MSYGRPGYPALTLSKPRKQETLATYYILSWHFVIVPLEAPCPTSHGPEEAYAHLRLGLGLPCPGWHSVLLLPSMQAKARTTPTPASEPTAMPAMAPPDNGAGWGCRLRPRFRLRRSCGGIVHSKSHQFHTSFASTLHSEPVGELRVGVVNNDPECVHVSLCMW